MHGSVIAACPRRVPLPSQKLPEIVRPQREAVRSNSPQCKTLADQHADAAGDVSPSSPLLSSRSLKRRNTHSISASELPDAPPQPPHQLLQPVRPGARQLIPAAPSPALAHSPVPPSTPQVPRADSKTSPVLPNGRHHLPVPQTPRPNRSVSPAAMWQGAGKAATVRDGAHAETGLSAEFPAAPMSETWGGSSSSTALPARPVRFRRRSDIPKEPMPPKSQVANFWREPLSARGGMRGMAGEYRRASDSHTEDLRRRRSKGSAGEGAPVPGGSALDDGSAFSRTMFRQVSEDVTSPTRARSQHASVSVPEEVAMSSRPMPRQISDDVTSPSKLSSRHASLLHPEDATIGSRPMFRQFLQDALLPETRAHSAFGDPAPETFLPEIVNTVVVDQITPDIKEEFKRLLIERYGTLDDAFRWFDFNGRGQLTSAQLGTGLKIMNLGPPLKFIKPKSFFSAMIGPGSPTIDLEAWRAFFGYTVATVFENASEGSETETVAPRTAMGKRESFRGAKLLERVSKLQTLARRNRKRKRSLQDLPSTFVLDSETGAGNSRMSGAQMKQRSGLAALMNALGNEDIDHMTDQMKSRISDVFEETDEHVAEALQLEEDINELSLEEIRALAYVLAAKCGSLDAAFKSLDYNSRGTIARVQWQSSLMIMHVDILALTGMKPGDIFVRMGGENGYVSKESWDKFFDGALTEEDRGMLHKATANFQRNTRNKLRMIWKAHPIGKAPGHEVENVDHGPRLVKSSSNSSLPSNNSGFSGDPYHYTHGKGFDGPSFRFAPGRDGNSQDDPGPGTAPPSRESSVNAKARRPAAHARGNGNRGPHGAGAHHAHADSHGDDRGDERGRAAATHKRPPATSTQDDAVHTQENLEKWKRALRERLKKLKPDEGLCLGKVTRQQRAIIQELAQELGLWHGWDDNGNPVLYREGPQSARFRRRIEEMKSGDYCDLDLVPAARWHYVRTVAAAVGLHCVAPDSKSQGDGADYRRLQMFNLKGEVDSFAEGIRRTLEALKEGEAIDFPDTLTEEQRQIVKKVAEELGLTFNEFQYPSGKKVASVGRLNAFEEEIRGTLEKLKPGESYTFSPDKCRTKLRQRVVQRIIEEMQGLSSNSRVPLTENADTGGFKVRRQSEAEAKSLDIGMDDEDCVKRNVDRLFGLVSSGHSGRVKVFLRKPDLFRFVDQACRANGRRVTPALLTEVETVYDNTLELQVDFGSRVKHGITVEYFQVFLSKAARSMGWSLVGILMGLLNWFQNDAEA